MRHSRLSFDKELSECRKFGGDCQAVIDKWKKVSDEQSAQLDITLNDNPLVALGWDKEVAEGGIQETLGIWPPNRGAYGPVEKVTLPTGELIDRYGSTKGTYTSPAGVPFENRALPSYSANAPYNVYEILKPIDDVSKSKVLPWFGQKGQGTQYELPKPVQWYIDNGYLGEKK